jgi:hypothetical protein
VSEPELAADSDRADGEHSHRLHLHKSHAALLLALLVTLLLWNIPFGQYALYPFKLFATWLHESSHGLVMLITGAGFDRMELYPDGSGLAYPLRGVTPLAQAAISSAGYVGTSFFGALFLVLGRTPRGARVVLILLSLLMALTAVLFLKNPFGIIAVLVGAAALGFLAWNAEEPGALFLMNLLGAQGCINAVLDIRVLFGATMMVNGKPSSSDAHTITRVVGGSPAMWATCWLAFSFIMFFVALKLSDQPSWGWWRRRVRRRPDRGAGRTP